MELEKIGELELAASYKTSWDTLMNVLDEMVLVLQDEKISFDEYVNFDFTSIAYPSFHSLDFNNDSFVTMDELNELFSYFKKSW